MKTSVVSSGDECNQCGLLPVFIIERNIKFHLEVSEIEDVRVFHPSSWTPWIPSMVPRAGTPALSNAEKQGSQPLVRPVVGGSRAQGVGCSSAVGPQSCCVSSRHLISCSGPFGEPALSRPCGQWLSSGLGLTASTQVAVSHQLSGSCWSIKLSPGILKPNRNAGEEKAWSKVQRASVIQKLGCSGNIISGGQYNLHMHLWEIF